MHKVTILNCTQQKTIYAKDGETLSNVLSGNSEAVEHPCGGRGVCKKCTVIVNGEKVLSCQYKITGDVIVQIPEKSNIATAEAGTESEQITDSMCLCLDIGTTTLVLALVATDENKIVKTITHNNPQRVFAADVMSRIDYSVKHGVNQLHEALITEVNNMVDELFESMHISHIDTLYVAGNTTMLHLFFNVPCETMGYAPYTPVFLQSKNMRAESLGIRHIGEVISLDGIAAFVGADIVSGLGYVKMPQNEKYNLMIDLGTNAEIALYSKEKLYCTAAAAGPCFEGVNISCGMSATEGAVYSYTGQRCMTIGSGEPKGICATGLIDVIAVLLDGEFIDETGFMEDGEVKIAPLVSITQEDIRQFQLAKSAIHAATLALIKNAKIDFDKIDKVFVAGGFSSKMNLGNAFKVGLFPRQLQGKIETVNNSSLLGLVKYACEKNDLSPFLQNAEYVDLAKDEYFQELFMENMMF